MTKYEFEEFCEFGEDTLEEHFEATLYLLYNWQWIGSKGKIVDLRKANSHYAESLLLWCAKHHTKNTPYMNTDQYKFLAKRIQILKRKELAIKNMFRREHNDDSTKS